MTSRRSIIKRREDDDLTMTRPLNKRVSFSANNHTRLFHIESDESRQTTFNSTAQQSCMDQTLAHDNTDIQKCSNSIMQMSCVVAPAEGEDAFDFDVDELWEQADVEPMEVVEDKENESRFSNARSSLDQDDKTRPVCLQKEQTEGVKSEILRVASKLLPSVNENDSDEKQKEALDIYGIKKTLNARQKPTPPLRSSQLKTVNQSPPIRERPGVRISEAFLGASQSSVEYSACADADISTSEDQTSSSITSFARTQEQTELSEHGSMVQSDTEDEQSLQDEEDDELDEDYDEHDEEQEFGDEEEDQIPDDEDEEEEEEMTNSMDDSTQWDQTNVDEDVEEDGGDASGITDTTEMNASQGSAKPLSSQSTVGNQSWMNVTGVQTFEHEESTYSSQQRTFDKSGPTRLSTIRTSQSNTTRISDHANETYSVHHKSEHVETSETSNLDDEPEYPQLMETTVNTTHVTSTVTTARRMKNDINDLVQKRLSSEPVSSYLDLSVFDAPIEEQPPLPDPPKFKGSLEIDWGALERTWNAEMNPKIAEYISSTKGTAERVIRELDQKIKEAEDEIERLTVKLISSQPFYEALPVGCFDIRTNFDSKSAVFTYRHNKLPCFKVTCSEKSKNKIHAAVECLDIPGEVCLVSRYFGTWIQTAFVGKTNWSESTWAKMQATVLSGFVVFHEHLKSFECVLDRLRWCQTKQQVYVNMVWGVADVRVYIDPNLQEQLEIGELPEGVINLVMDDLHQAWKNSNGLLSYRERIDNVLRTSLKLAAEKAIQNATGRLTKV